MKHSAKDMPLITNLVYKGNGKIWAAETNPPPADPKDGSIDAMAKRWPLAFGLSCSNAAYYSGGQPAYCLGSNLSYGLTLTNNTGTAGNYTNEIENLDVTTTQAYYQAHGETNLPGAAVEAFPRAYVPPDAMAPDTALALADAYAIPPEVYPGTNRLALELGFGLANDANNRLIQVGYPYAGLWLAATSSNLPPAAPLLSVTRSASNSVLICWPYPSEGFGLQQCTNLTTANWATATNERAQVSNEWQVTVTPVPTGKRYGQYFRLQWQP